MELYQLNTFVIVAEEKNITRAAQRLFTTPSSVSMHIKALEDELDVQLFVRTSRGVEITEVGRVLCEKAQQTLFAAHDVISSAAKVREQLGGQVRLALNASPAFLRIPALVTQLQRLYPGIEIDLVNSSSGDIVRDLRRETVDLGFMYGDIQDASVAVYPLAEAELVIAAPLAWEKRLNDASWDEIAHLPWIDTGHDCPFQPLIDGLFTPRGLRYERLVCSKDDRTRRELVAAGLGMSLLERGEAEAAIAQGQPMMVWPGERITCPLALVGMAHRRREPLIDAMTQVVLSMWTKRNTN
jgi:DNA-binding transcriptional LysR family regulator